MFAFFLFLAMFALAFAAAGLAVTFCWAAMQARARAAGVQEQEDEEDVLGLFRDDASEISTIRLWRALLERVGHVDRVRKVIAEANLGWPVGRVTMMMLMCALLAASVVGSAAWVPWPVGVAAAGVGGSMPYVYILARRRKRLERFAAQFPDALDSLARALKAGYPLGASMDLLAREQADPLGAEIRRTTAEWRLGTNWESALESMAERIPLAEVRMFTSAVNLQNRVGGKLNEVLTRLAETMRERVTMEGEVRSITAHSRITGAVLTALPVGIGVVMLFTSTEYMMKLLTSGTGRAMLLAAAAANVAAHFLIRRIARVRA